jgi:prophage regulatory protein
MNRSSGSIDPEPQNHHCTAKSRNDSDTLFLRCNMANQVRQARSDWALIRRKQVEQLVQLSRSTIYDAVKKGNFPAPYKISSRAVAWKLSEVEQWLEARPLASTTV